VRPRGRLTGLSVLLYPAIDILDGRAVRLRQGDFDDPTVYADDPVVAAQRWAGAGARFLHVVDLDGARAGTPHNLEALAGIALEVGLPVQFGGGLRTAEAVADALSAGAARVVLGTAAARDPDLRAAMLKRYGDRVAVAVDVRGGQVASGGWTENTQHTPESLLDALRVQGVETIIYTDIDRDGMLEGPDLELVTAVAERVPGRLVYSGGIGSLADLERLASVGRETLAGVIVGKALYEGRFSIAEAQAVLGA